MPCRTSRCRHADTLLTALAFASAASAGPQYANLGKGATSLNIERQVIAPGGGRASGDGWQLDGTLGQVAAGRATGGTFTLDSGYWAAEPPTTEIFANGFEDTP